MDNKNNIWVGSSRGLLVIEAANQKSKLIQAFKEKFISDVKIKNTDEIFVAAENTISKYSVIRDSVIKIDLEKFREWNKNNFISQIEYNENGDLWIATNSGLFSLNENESKLQKFSHEPDNPHSLSGNNINKIFLDRGGVLWASSYNAGLNKIITAPENFKNILVNSAARSFVEKDNKIWAASFGSGIIQLDKSDKIIRHASNIDKENFVFALVDYNEDNLLLSTQAGPRLFNITNNKYKPYAHPKFLSWPAIGSFLNNSGIIYGGTYGNGLLKFDITTGEVSKKLFDEELNNSQTVNYILSILADGDDLYLGTYGGLIRINKNQELKLFSHSDNDSNSISHNYVFALSELNENRILVGTSNGLNIFDKKTERFESYFEYNGLPNSVINGIIKDDEHNIWISTNNGLSKFNRKINEFINYKIGDGLHSNLFLPRSYFKTSEGRFLFGTQQGIVLFYPDNIRLSNYDPHIAITKVVHPDNAESLISGASQNSLTLPYDQNSIEFHFASFDYENPDNIKYKYLLEGYDKDWYAAGGTSHAAYKNLPPGEYNFKVIGTNSSGVWSSRLATITFIITPPFYLTWWFLTISILAFILMIYFIYRYNINRKINHAIAAEKIKSEEREKVRRKTALDFHDELGHVLTRINLLVELVSRKIPENDNVLRPILNKISQSSFQLYNGTRDFIWSIDPKNDSLYELLIRLKDFGDELFMDTDIFFEVNGISEDYRQMKLSTDWRRHLALIFKEGMTNTLKYSHSKKVILNTDLSKDELCIALEDDGEGFSMLKEYKGNGLKNMKKRAEKLNSVLDINSNYGEGTRILFKGKVGVGSFQMN
jgi:signal transduction histidine kinase/ligand-binding sensor domain-containing protein